MRLSDLLVDIGRPVSYHPGVARAVGGVKSALLLEQLVYWTGKQHDREGWIFKTKDELMDELGFSREELDGARAALKRLGLLEENYLRLEHRMAYRVNINALNAMWESYTQRLRLLPKAGFPLSAEGENQVRQHEQPVLGKMEKASSSKHRLQTETTSKITTTTPPPAAAYESGGGDNKALPDILELRQLRADPTLRFLSESQVAESVEGLNVVLAQQVLDELTARSREGRDGTGKPVQQNGWPLLKHLAKAARDGVLQPTPGGKKVAKERQRQREQAGASSQAARAPAVVDRAAGLVAARQLRALISS